MKRKVYIHRDTMLERVGYMPHRRYGESDESWERRKGMEAIAAQKQYGLVAYPIPGKRGFRYDQDEVDAAAATIKPIERT